MDFIVGLPVYKGNTVILVVVDRFSKGIHLGMLPTGHTAHMVASLFLNIVVKLHGFPRSIVSDRDPLFISQFWRDLFSLSGTLLRLSSAYHPQSDGQTEVLNRVIEQYLRAFVHEKQGTWGKYLPWVEWSHNSAWSATTGSTPYEITYGRKPLTFPDYLAGTSKNDAVDEFLVDRETTFHSIRKKLLKDQETMKRFADAKRRDVVYQPNDWVLVKLRPRRQLTARGSNARGEKLAKRYYGPFRIVDRIGAAAYRLQLPEGTRVHPVFHCSVLKPFIGTVDSITSPTLPLQFEEGQPVVTPLTILRRRQIPGTLPIAWEVLVQWDGLSPDEATWENWHHLCHEYHLEDKVDFQGAEDVTHELKMPDTQETPASMVQRKEETKRKIVKPVYLADYV